MSTTLLAINADDTSLEGAQANVLLSSTAECEHMNENLKSIYLTAFNNWKRNVEAGRIDNKKPPKPPNGFVVTLDPVSGFSFPEPGKDPVCDMPEIPIDYLTPKPAPAPNTIEVGHLIYGKWFQVGANDTFPSGMTTPPVPNADASDLHTYEKFGAPVGAGWYLQVS